MKKIRFILVLLTILALLAGCGSDSLGVAPKNADMAETYSLSSKLSDNAIPDRKIIETFKMNIETKDFDSFMRALDEQISSLGGYIESSVTYNNNRKDTFLRSAELTVRIPKDKCSGFTDFIAKESNITFKEMNTEDVTLNYVDTQSRISALTAQKDSLEKLLAAAENVSDIMAISNELTDVIYELESYQSQLRTLDNQVDYSTLALNISEVERTTAAEKQGLWQEIGKNLSDNFADVWHGLQRFFVFLISSIPYLLVLAVIGVIVAMIIIFSGKRRRRRKNDEK